MSHRTQSHSITPFSDTMKPEEQNRNTRQSHLIPIQIMKIEICEKDLKSVVRIFPSIFYSSFLSYETIGDANDDDCGGAFSPLQEKQQQLKPCSNEEKKKDETAHPRDTKVKGREELNLLAQIIGNASGKAKEFRLNLFPSEDYSDSAKFPNR